MGYLIVENMPAKKYRASLKIGIDMARG